MTETSSLVESTDHADTAAPWEDLAERLRLIIGRLARRLRQQALGDLTPSQRSVLASLHRHGPLRMGELARIENITPPSLTGIVGRLEEKELVERADDPSDARSTVVTATEEAIRRLDRARREKTALLATRLTRLSHQERDLLERAIALLDRIVADE